MDGIDSPQMRKDPGSSRNFGVNWAYILPIGATVASVAWTLPAGLTSVTTGVNGSTGIVRLAGGVLGNTYEVLGVATFSNGEIDPRRLYITMAKL